MAVSHSLVLSVYVCFSGIALLLLTGKCSVKAKYKLLGLKPLVSLSSYAGITRLEEREVSYNAGR